MQVDVASINFIALDNGWLLYNLLTFGFIFLCNLFISLYLLNYEVSHLIDKEPNKTPSGATSGIILSDQT
uniref:Uncharacterized protein n=1 Tax=Siphoviridae sp. ctcfw7 TaxID=2826394 RepID=A0A8S5MGV0_9CAUD|nr:MAG TPA: hypothetical protein [Siphoviridae sp. ctcfw7]